MRKMTVLLDKSRQISYSYTLSRVAFTASSTILQEIFYDFFQKNLLKITPDSVILVLEGIPGRHTA